VLALVVASLWRSYGPAEAAAMVGEGVVNNTSFLCLVRFYTDVENKGRPTTLVKLVSPRPRPHLASPRKVDPRPSPSNFAQK
jgi:hypothetical protein